MLVCRVSDTLQHLQIAAFTRNGFTKQLELFAPDPPSRPSMASAFVETRSENFNDRVARPRDNALAIAADTGPPLVLPSHTIPGFSLVPAGACVAGHLCKGPLGGPRRYGPAPREDKIG